MAGIILSWFGFVANEAQTATSMAGIRFMFSVCPAAFALMGIVAIYFYRIDRNMIGEIERDLSVRHSTT